MMEAGRRVWWKKNRAEWKSQRPWWKDRRAPWLLRNVLCGALIGAGSILPGVSGGAMAAVFGVYRPFLDLLSHPKSAIARNRDLFLSLGIGWGIGFLIFARGLAAVAGLSYAVTAWLFIGLIAGTLPAMFREAGREGRPPAAWISMTVCGLCFFGGLFYVRHILRFTAKPNVFWNCFCGFLWGVGTVIPGFSASPVMMSLGLYYPMLDHLSRMDFAALAACLPTMILTVLFLARLVNQLFQKFYPAVSHGVVGVVAASIAAIVPAYCSTEEALWSALCCIAGFALAFGLERLDQRLQKSDKAS